MVETTSDKISRAGPICFEVGSSSSVNTAWSVREVRARGNFMFEMFEEQGGLMTHIFTM